MFSGEEGCNHSIIASLRPRREKSLCGFPLRVGPSFSSLFFPFSRRSYLFFPPALSPPFPFLPFPFLTFTLPSSIYFSLAITTSLTSLYTSFCAFLMSCSFIVWYDFSRSERERERVYTGLGVRKEKEGENNWFERKGKTNIKCKN